MKEEKLTTKIIISRELWGEVKKLATMKGKSASEVVEELLRKALKEISQ